MIEVKTITLPTSMLDPTPVRFDCPYWDLLPPLSPAEQAALKTSMEEHGQQTALTVALVRLDHYRVLDGWHRLSIGESLNYSAEDVPIHSIGDDGFYTEEQLHDLAIELNLRRRHLSPEARVEWATKLRLQGKSYPQIAEQMGVSVGTAYSAVKEGNATLSTLKGSLPETITGADGKAYPATQPPREAKKEILPAEEKAPPAPSLLIKGRLGGTGPDLFDDAVAQVRAREEHRTSPVTPTEETSIEYVEYGKGQEEPTHPCNITGCGQPRVFRGWYCAPHQEAKTAELAAIGVNLPLRPMPSEAIPPMLATQSEPGPVQPEAAPSSQSSPLSAQPTATQTEVAASVEASFAKAGQLDPKTLLPVAPKIVGVEASTPTKEPSWQHWNTPPWLVDLIKSVAPIALDPCSNPTSMVNAGSEILERENGLSPRYQWAEIAKGNLVYINPPYEDPEPWAERAIQEAALGAEIILCLPSSHSAGWWQWLIQNARACVLLFRRVDFWRDGVSKNGSRGETTIFYLGSRFYRQFYAAFEPQGFLAEVEVRAPLVEREAIPPPVDPRQQALPQEVAPQSEAIPTPPKEEDRNEWLAKAIEEIKSKNDASQVDETGKRLLPEAPTELDRQYFAAFLIEWKHEKPPAKPYNDKSPAPKKKARRP